MADTRGKESTLDTPAIVVSDGARSSYGGYVQADYQLAEEREGDRRLSGEQDRRRAMSRWCRGQVSFGGLAPKVAVKALYGQAFRAPYINELHIDHPGLLGNPNLKSEHVSSVDLEVSYSGADIELVAKYFDNRQTDSIIEVLLAGETRPHYENAGLANVSGVEFSGKRYVSKAFYLTGSLLYQTSDDGNGHARHLVWLELRRQGWCQLQHGLRHRQPVRQLPGRCRKSPAPDAQSTAGTISDARVARPAQHQQGVGCSRANTRSR